MSKLRYELKGVLVAFLLLSPCLHIPVILAEPIEGTKEGAENTVFGLMMIMIFLNTTNEYHIETDTQNITILEYSFPYPINSSLLVILTTNLNESASMSFYAKNDNIDHHILICEITLTKESQQIYYVIGDLYGNIWGEYIYKEDTI